MEYTQLGRAGVKVSRIVLGTMNFGPATDEDEAHPLAVAARTVSNRGKRRVGASCKRKDRRRRNAGGGPAYWDESGPGRSPVRALLKPVRASSPMP